MSESRRHNGSRHVLVSICFWLMVLTAPAPVVASLLNGRAGWFALTWPITLGLFALAQWRHEDPMDCDRCMGSVYRIVAAVETADPLPEYVPPAPVAARDFADRYATHASQHAGSER